MNSNAIGSNSARALTAVLFAVLLLAGTPAVHAQSYDTYGGGYDTYGYGYDTYGGGYDTYGSGYNTYGGGYDTYGSGYNTYGGYDTYGSGYNTYGSGYGYDTYTPSYNTYGSSYNTYNPFTYDTYSPTYDTYTPTYDTYTGGGYIGGGFGGGYIPYLGGYGGFGGGVTYIPTVVNPPVITIPGGCTSNCGGTGTGGGITYISNPITDSYNTFASTTYVTSNPITYTDSFNNFATSSYYYNYVGGSSTYNNYSYNNSGTGGGYPYYYGGNYGNYSYTNYNTATPCSISVSQNNIAPGQGTTLYWSSQSMSYGSISGIGSVQPNGSTNVAPLQTTTYSASFFGPGGTYGACSVTLIVGQTPYVTLSQVPYTGLDLGPVGTAIYWAVLVLLCALFAYLVAVKKIHRKLISSVSVALVGDHSEVSHPAYQNHAVHATKHSASGDDFLLSQIHRNK